MTAAEYQNQYATKQSKAKAQKLKQPPAAEPLRAKKANVLIGIDPGTNTGCAVKEGHKWQSVETLTIFEAINRVIEWKKSCDAHLWTMIVRIEDARKRTWFGKSGAERWKGAGSIGRDCAIWEETLTALGIPFEMVHPKNVKSTTSDGFKKITGWQGRTSIHAREAAWLLL